MMLHENQLVQSFDFAAYRKEAAQRRLEELRGENQRDRLMLSEQTLRSMAAGAVNLYPTDTVLVGPTNAVKYGGPVFVAETAKEDMVLAWDVSMAGGRSAIVALRGFDGLWFRRGGEGGHYEPLTIRRSAELLFPPTMTWVSAVTEALPPTTTIEGIEVMLIAALAVSGRAPECPVALQAMAMFWE